MKKGLLIIFCLIMALFLLPGGMASWGGDLFIGGTVTTGEFLQDEDQAGKPAPDNEKDQPKEKKNEEPDKEDKKDKKPEPPLTEYLLTISTSGQGDTTPGQGSYVYKQGQEVKLKAKPTEGWIFNKWLIGDSELSNPKIIIIINNDISVEAVFIEADVGSENGEDGEGEKGDNGDSTNGKSGGEEPSDQEEPSVDSGDQDGAEQ